MKKYTYTFIAGIVMLSACKSKKVTTEAVTNETTPVEKTSIEKHEPGSLDDRLAKQEEMYTQIGISEAQKVKFRAIETNYANKMRSVRDANASDKNAMNTELQVLQNEKIAEIKGLLTSDQFTKYDTALAQMRENRRGERKK